MFQDYLTSSEKGLRTEIAWIRNLDGVVRVPVFDPQREGFAYVVVYAEKRRSYEALAFDSETGAERWTQRIVNGGYGAPAVRDDQLIVLSAFTDVEALDSRTGRRLWRFSTKKRIRSAIIVSDGTAFFSSGGD